jgi:acetyl esterase/lipase
MKSFEVKLTNEMARLTCYVHDKSVEMQNADIRPAMLVLPGGGYRMCSDREADPVALAYLAEGFNAFILRYTVGTDEPVSKAFDDADEAVAYLHANAGELNIDVNRLAVVGFSAGGHLAARLSVFGKIKPAAAILGYPAIIADIGKRLNKEFPELCANADNTTPPTFIFTTRDDAVVAVKNSLQYAEALDRAGVGFELHIYASGAHGLSMAKPYTSSGKAAMVNADVSGWFALSVNWLHKILGDFSYK